MSTHSGMDLTALVDALNSIAPLGLAGSWDNVGLLVDVPSARPVRRIMLTIDLSEAVMAEALKAEVNAIVAYHRPIFRGLKRLSTDVPMSRNILRAVEAGIAIYSPHTALDAVVGGVGDWLLSGLGPMHQVRPIEPSNTLEGCQTGQGRWGRLTTPTSLSTLTSRLSTHLGLSTLRAARTDRHAQELIETVAVCPGAGGGLFQSVNKADLYVTGEMQHHDILARVEGGSSVLLTEHTNSERGFLPTYGQRITQVTAHRLEVLISTADADPLSVVRSEG